MQELGTNTMRHIDPNGFMQQLDMASERDKQFAIAAVTALGGGIGNKCAS